MRALQLRVAGMTYDAIAAQEVQRGLKQRSADAVRADVRKTLSERLSEPVEHTRALDAERLDSLNRAVETVLRAAQGGRCGSCGRGGDDELLLKAAGQMLRLLERRAHLLGHDVQEPEVSKPASPLSELRDDLAGVRAKRRFAATRRRG